MIKNRFKSFNILGQKRGEIVVRHLLIIFVGILILVLALFAFVGKKEQNSDPVNAETTTPVVMGTDGAGNVVADGDVVNGQKVVVEDGKAMYIQEYDPLSATQKAVQAFTKSYRGSRIDDTYFDALRKNCDDETLRTVVAISVAETGMGRDVKNKSNFYGWFKGGNRNYDPSVEEMTKEICNGIKSNYIGIGKNDSMIKKYVGYASTAWKNNYNWAYNQMEVK